MCLLYKMDESQVLDELVCVRKREIATNKWHILQRGVYYSVAFLSYLSHLIVYSIGFGHLERYQSSVDDAKEATHDLELAST